MVLNVHFQVPALKNTHVGNVYCHTHTHIYMHRNRVHIKGSWLDPGGFGNLGRSRSVQQDRHSVASESESLHFKDPKSERERA